MEFANNLQCNNTEVGVQAGDLLELTITGSATMKKIELNHDYDFPSNHLEWKTSREKYSLVEKVDEYLSHAVPCYIYSWYKEILEREFYRGWEECAVEYDIDV